MSDTFDTFSIAIMAAGKGTRLKSRRPKVLHEIGGQALLLHVIAAARTVVPAERILCIVGHEAESVQAAVATTGVQFVLQPEQRGTGHALQMVKRSYRDGGIMPPEHLLVLSGDVPLIQAQTIRDLCELHLAEHAAMTILTAVPPSPTGYGRVLRKAAGSVEVEAIVEQKSLKPEQLAAPEINSGIYCFETAKLFPKLDLLGTDNAHGEYYLTDVAAMLVADGERVVALKAGSVDEVLGANTIAEMMHLDQAMRVAVAASLMAAGVTIFRPDTCVIDAGVEVGPDTVIEPYVQLWARLVSARRLAYARIPSSRTRRLVTVFWCVTDVCLMAQRSAIRQCLAPTRICGRKAVLARQPTWAILSRPKRSR